MKEDKINKMVDGIIQAIDTRMEKKPKSYFTQAKVIRTENGTAYVHIPGGVDETPVKETIACRKGDTVQVRVGDGSAVLVGNQTAPPTDDAEALVARAVAKVADKNATEAKTTADEAQQTANAVSGIANTALTQAQEAKQIADDTEQHFWFTETGTDTGAHITEVPQEEWSDPSDPNYQSGGNLLARSNGIAIREGMAELATMSQAGFNAITYDGYGNPVTIAHLGYGAGKDSGGGTSDAPYYDIGVRKSGTTKGNYSTAEGYNTEASDYTSHAEGFETTAMGRATHAEGYRTIANWGDAHAEGYYTTADRADAHAEGDHTVADGIASHAGGQYTKAGYTAQTAIGKYNDNKQANAFEIGNGTADTARSNAFEVTWTGDVTAGGDITVGGHATPIGYNGTTTNTSATRADSTSYAGIGLQVSLPKGVWMLTGTITFASNTTGRRAVRLTDAGTAIACSEVVSPPANGAATALHTSAVVENTTSSNRTYAMQCYQNSGATRNVTGELRYVRIA